MKKHEIPKNILERVESELLPDEELLWIGQPHPTRFLFGQSNKTHPLLASLIGLEIAVFVSAFFTASLLFIGLSFLALLLTTLIGAILQQVLLARNTIYAISNQRALTIRGNQVETSGKKDLQSIVKKTNSNGRGDIIFRKDTESKISPTGFGLMLHRQVEKERGFMGIENPNHVELLLLNTFGDNARIERLVDHDADDGDIYFEDEYQTISRET